MPTLFNARTGQQVDWEDTIEVFNASCDPDQVGQWAFNAPAPLILEPAPIPEPQPEPEPGPPHVPVFQHFVDHLPEGSS